jgi:ABC-type multidrug transport system ATPase subunit
MPDSAVHVEGVVKRFGTTTAFAGVDPGCRGGHAVWAVGADGAGKTTLVRVLATLIAPDAGVFGRDVVHDAVPQPAATVASSAAKRVNGVSSGGSS